MLPQCSTFLMMHYLRDSCWTLQCKVKMIQSDLFHFKYSWNRVGCDWWWKAPDGVVVASQLAVQSYIIQSVPPPHMPNPPTPGTPTTQVHVKSLPPTFMGCDLWERNANMSFKNSNVQHTEEALAPSCSVTGTVTGGRRWTELCSPLHVVTDAVTNILKRAEVSCTTQLLEFESLGFFFRPSPLFSVTSFLFQSKQFDIFSCWKTSCILNGDYSTASAQTFGTLCSTFA